MTHAPVDLYVAAYSRSTVRVLTRSRPPQASASSVCFHERRPVSGAAPPMPYARTRISRFKRRDAQTRQFSVKPSSASSRLHPAHRIPATAASNLARITASTALLIRLRSSASIRGVISPAVESETQLMAG